MAAAVGMVAVADRVAEAVGRVVAGMAVADKAEAEEVVVEADRVVGGVVVVDMAVVVVDMAVVVVDTIAVCLAVVDIVADLVVAEESRIAHNTWYFHRILYRSCCMS